MLRTALGRAEGGAGTTAAVAFGAGIAAVVLQMLLQVVQVAMASVAGRGLSTAAVSILGGVAWAMSVVAYVPLAVVLAAVALGSFSYRAFPRWVGWLSAGASAAHLIMTLGLVADAGPLLPGGALTYALYGIVLIWLIATTTTMVWQERVDRSP